MEVLTCAAVTAVMVILARVAGKKSHSQIIAIYGGASTALIFLKWFESAGESMSTAYDESATKRVLDFLTWLYESVTKA